MNSKKYHITLNGKVYEVEIEEVTENSKNVVQSNNVQNKEIKKPQNNTSSEKNIKAPMPGTIVNVLVKSGDKVKKGQVVAILEAMKMENEIIAQQDGVIKNVNVDKGQNVSLGDDLLEIA